MSLPSTNNLLHENLPAGTRVAIPVAHRTEVERHFVLENLTWGRLPSLDDVRASLVEILCDWLNLEMNNDQELLEKNQMIQNFLENEECGVDLLEKDDQVTTERDKEFYLANMSRKASTHSAKSYKFNTIQGNSELSSSSISASAKVCNVNRLLFCLILQRTNIIFYHFIHEYKNSFSFSHFRAFLIFLSTCFWGIDLKNAYLFSLLLLMLLLIFLRKFIQTSFKRNLKNIWMNLRN